jgi:rhodanese-related sulfurtransferase
MLSSLDRGKAYLVHCRTGIGSGRAAVIMADLGFLEIYDLSYGISRWHQEGFKVTKQPELDE